MQPEKRIKLTHINSIKVIKSKKGYHSLKFFQTPWTLPNFFGKTPKKLTSDSIKVGNFFYSTIYKPIANYLTSIKHHFPLLLF
jgi:hypothetical protein